MYDYEYENNVLLFLRLLKFLHTDQPEVLDDHERADADRL